MTFEIDKVSLSDIANIFMAITTFFAATIAFLQYKKSKNEARDINAKSLYMDYLKLAFDNPKFSLASYPVENPRFSQIVVESDDYCQYEFYVSNLLFAIEEILNLADWNNVWEETVIEQLTYHAIYLNSMDFPEHHYDERLLYMREVAIKRYVGDGGIL
ncbi:hypothetical protein [Candidatus Albibeggiatoa sp. nov. NOAA]|uniref:hypothetical protein n=1 Tax=Candidatus Albibeggiatoa sp. nov. NOAA TaxID=3162724 RepID=UPI0032FB8FBA|nr:hypothetical protein [Thiotrichaceae bacterium]